MRPPIQLMGHLPLITTCPNTKQSHDTGTKAKVYILTIYADALNCQHNSQKHLASEINND